MSWRWTYKTACWGLLWPAVANAQAAQVPQDAAVVLELPKGAWTLVIRPAPPAIDHSAPVSLFQVRTHAGMGMTVTRAGLINHSSQAVIGVRLGWTLYKNSSADVKLLTVGTTQLIVLSRSLNAGEAAQVSAPIISFADPLRKLIPAPGAGLTGSFSIELSPFELQFEDGKSWFAGSPLPKSSELEFEIGEVKVVPLTEILRLPCPDQRCEYDGRLQCFVCTSDTNYYCNWESCLACNTGWCMPLNPESR